MTRVFWDTMLFIYMVQNNMEFLPRVKEMLQRSYQRGDMLLTSHFAVGEVMVGAPGDRDKALAFRSVITEMGFQFLPFDGGAVSVFADLRAQQGLKAPDSINLACAASAGIDVFLTNDNQLLKRGLFVPGIKVIGDFKLPIL
jgi:predicted nucleic acid-binding protein